LPSSPEPAPTALADEPGLAARSASFALGALTVASLGFADGGYFSSSWGWATLGLAWAVMVAALLGGETRVASRPLVLLTLLIALGVWIAASLAWTRSVSLTVPELQRLLVYATGVGAAVLVVRGRSWSALVRGTLSGASIVVVYGLVDYLVTREQPPTAFEHSLLHEPMGYANAMAITAVLAIVLALGIVVDGRHVIERIGAGVLLVPLSTALTLADSRASWAALFVGVGLALGLAERRGRALGTALAASIVPALAVGVVTASDATDLDITGARADRLGERLLVVVALLTLVAAVPAWLAVRERAASVDLGLVKRWPVMGVVASVLVLAAAGLAVAGLGVGGDRPTYWRVAVQELGEHPLLGTGAGTYGQVWLERRPNATSVRDAHSVAVETLSELGVVGLALVLVLLLLPLGWAVVARTTGLVPFVAGAFAAYGTHAALDWDWEMPAVTLAGLFCAVALGVAADSGGPSLTVSRAQRVLIVALGAGVAALGFLGLLGARAVTDAAGALARGDAVTADRRAQRAERLQPWSVEPLLVRGQAALARHDRRLARTVFARAVERDPNDYRAWLALASVSPPEEAQLAVLKARALNPRAARSP
jgi:O-antigen ligase